MGVHTLDLKRHWPVSDECSKVVLKERTHAARRDPSHERHIGESVLAADDFDPEVALR